MDVGNSFLHGKKRDLNPLKRKSNYNSRIIGLKGVENIKTRENSKRCQFKFKMQDSS
jgi:hypothetical protein